MSDDLVKRLRATTDGATVNPDGPEAAARIAELEAVLRATLAVTERRKTATFNVITDGIRAVLEGGKS